MGNQYKRGIASVTIVVLMMLLVGAGVGVYTISQNSEQSGADKMNDLADIKKETETTNVEIEIKDEIREVTKVTSEDKPVDIQSSQSLSKEQSPGGTALTGVTFETIGEALKVGKSIKCTGYSSGGKTGQNGVLTGPEEKRVTTYVSKGHVRRDYMDGGKRVYQQLSPNGYAFYSNENGYFIRPNDEGSKRSIMSRAHSFLILWLSPESCVELPSFPSDVYDTSQKTYLRDLSHLDDSSKGACHGICIDWTDFSDWPSNLQDYYNEYYK